MVNLNFSSDNIASISPQIMAALIATNEGIAMPYGQDSETLKLRDDMRRIFEHDTLEVLPVASGCAANCLCLSAMVASDQAVLCHELAHIHTDERGGPEFYTQGSKLISLHSDRETLGAKLRAISVHKTLETFNWDKEHVVLPAAISITQLTERGACYELSEISDICGVAKEWGLRTHMDGARFANALVSLGCSPAEMTWKAGIDALSFGATKNGAMGADPVVLFDPSLEARARAMRKRGGHTLSKMRYISAQVRGYLQDDHWLDNAHNANTVAATIAKGISDLPLFELIAPVQGNQLFIKAPSELLDSLEKGGALIYRLKPDLIRMVCAWNQSLKVAEHFVQLCQHLVAQHS